MSVTIRLARIGKRNAPAYKVVVANTRDKRNGRFLDVLGHYNPSHNPVLLEIDEKKVKEWQEKGALTSDAVTKLMEGTYEFQPYTRQNEVQKDSESVDPAKSATEEEKKPEDKESAEETKDEGAKNEPEKPTEPKEGDTAESPENPKE